MKKQNDLYAIKNHRFEDDEIHAAILADGDHEAAKEVGDDAARDIGLTDEQIKALSTPPKKRTGK